LKDPGWTWFRSAFGRLPRNEKQKFRELRPTRPIKQGTPMNTPTQINPLTLEGNFYQDGKIIGPVRSAVLLEKFEVDSGRQRMRVFPEDSQMTGDETGITVTLEQ
jgi:hypothetical protein